MKIRPTKINVFLNHWRQDLSKPVRRNLLFVRAMSTEKEPTSDVLDKMRGRLRNESDPDRAWESLWKDNMTPWDLGTATPALRSELASHWKTSPDKPVLRTLVPGCGAGYDLVTLARHHDDLVASGHVKKASVVGLDLSETSLSRAAEVLESACEFDPLDRPTRVDLVKGDFMDTLSWETMYSFGGDESGCWKGGNTCQASFDFIFDYTFFCALPPSLREAWGKQIAHLLTPETGRLLTLIFPILEEGAEMVGPPYPVSIKDYKQVLLSKGVVMEAAPHENPDTVSRRAGKELACWWTRLDDTKAKL